MNETNNISPEELERIERYLANEMDESEAQAFNTSLATDIPLREKMEEVKLLLLGLKEMVLEKQLDSFHREITPATVSKRESKVVPLGRKLLVAASILAIIALSTWWFLQSGSKNEKLYSQYYTPDPGLATVMGGASNYDFEKAMVEYKNGEYNKALNAWTALLKAKPGNDTILYFIGAASQANKDDDAAIKNLQQVATNTASAFYKDACWYLGLSYLKKGEKKLAIEHIEKSGRPQSASVIQAINK